MGRSRWRGEVGVLVVVSVSNPALSVVPLVKPLPETDAPATAALSVCRT